MQLIHVPLERLSLSALNVRKKGGKEAVDLVPSIRALGLLQPLLVRKDGDGFEIVAGQRRYHALTKLAADGSIAPVPCMVMEDGEDAIAIEASLAENIARLPMDEIDQYKAFAALAGEGLEASEIASRFGVTERLVRQRMAIANLIDPILNAYRRDEIRADTLRILTMATPRQQKEWWKMFKDAEVYAPQGGQLRAWLFGGAQVPVSSALFDESAYPGAIVSDLFGEERYFADSAAFWPLQNAAIAERREAYLASGWRKVVILDIGEHFAEWEHRKAATSKGGKVFISVARNGEVAFHEGYVSAKDAKRAKEGDEDTPAKPERREITKAMENYLALHRHSAVSAALLDRPDVALRLVVLHMLVGSPLWSVRPEPVQAHSQPIMDSVRASRGHARIAEVKREVVALLCLSNPHDDEPVIGVPGCMIYRICHSDLFDALMQIDDNGIMQIMTYLMAESLSANDGGLVSFAGEQVGIDMRDWWTPDPAFFSLLRDKEAINAMLREVAGDATADAHLTSTAKVQKGIIDDCLAGNGREKAEGWLPRYLAFPASGYTTRFEDDGPALESGVAADDSSPEDEAPFESDEIKDMPDAA